MNMGFGKKAGRESADKEIPVPLTTTSKARPAKPAKLLGLHTIHVTLEEGELAKLAEGLTLLKC